LQGIVTTHRSKAKKYIRNYVRNRVGKYFRTYVGKPVGKHVTEVHQGMERACCHRVRVDRGRGRRPRV